MTCQEMIEEMSRKVQTTVGHSTVLNHHFGSKTRPGRPKPLEKAANNQSSALW
jgi:hypothetical protein